MAGLIANEMQQGGAPTQGGGMQASQMPDQNAQQMMPGEMDQDDEDIDIEDPGLQQAIQFAMQALYENDGAKKVAASLRSAPNRTTGLSDTAYQMVSIVEEKTQGSVPDELLIFFATTVLEEVVEIGDAAGIDYTPTEIAEAFKKMILRYMKEMGADTTQLEQAMNQVDSTTWDQVAAAEE